MSFYKIKKFFKNILKNKKFKYLLIVLILIYGIHLIFSIKLSVILLLVYFGYLVKYFLPD